MKLATNDPNPYFRLPKRLATYSLVTSSQQV